MRDKFRPATIKSEAKEEAGKSTGLKTRHYKKRFKQETIRAQNYQGWEQVLRKIYPAAPRTAPAPLPKTLHRATVPPGAQPPAPDAPPAGASTPASG
jgi:hypothetical protein